VGQAASSVGTVRLSSRRSLVKKLKKEGYWVRGVDIKERQSRGPGTGHEFAPTQADEFLLLDLRQPQNCRAALTLRQALGPQAQGLRAQDRRRSGW